MLTRRAFGAVLLAAGGAAGGEERIVVAGRVLRFGAMRVRCAVGRTGVKAEKREGDGATPAGTFPLREVLYRADREPAPKTGLPVSAIAAGDGWSDDPADPEYNRRAAGASTFHRETLWRRDGLYDVLAVIGANDDPVVPGRGSAIFLHVARPDLGGTDGCVALPKAELLRVLERAGAGTVMEILA